MVIAYLIAVYVTGWTTEFTRVEFLRNFSIVLGAYGAFCILALQLWEREVSDSVTREQRRKADTAFGDRWTGYWHPEDEAISALVNVAKVSGPIVPHTFLQPVVAGFQFAIVLGLGLWVAYDTVRNGIILEFLVDDLYFIAGMFTSDAQSQNIVLFALVCFLFLFVSCAILLAAWVLKKLLLLAGIPLSGLINRVIWRSVRDRAWGDDLTQEGVRSVAPHPPGFSKRFDPIPELVAAPLREHSDSNAIDTLNKVRMILGMSRNGSGSSDIKSELAESLQWKELIHTSYFDVPVFIDLLALGLHRGGLASFTGDLATKPVEVEALEAWLDRSGVTKRRIPA
jgi:hypothetical protein